MNTNQHQTRSIWRRVYNLFLLMTLICLGGGAALAQKSPCDDISIAPKYSGQGCCWGFTINNGQSTYWIGTVQANVLTPGSTVSSATGPFGVPATTPTSVTWNFPNNLPPNGSQGGLGVCFNTSTNPVSVEFVYLSQGRVVCRDTIAVDCPTTQQGCYKVVEQRAECVKLPTGATGYALTFMIQNQSSWPMTYLTLNAPGVTFNPATVTFSPAILPGGWATVNVTLTGATPGVLVINGVLCDSTRQRCCEGKFEVKLPECPKEEGCFKLGQQSILCRYNPQLEFVWSFNILNEASWPATYLSFSPMTPGVTVAPPTVVLGVIPPNTWTPMQTVVISGPGAVPGSTIMVILKMCDRSRQHCCFDTLRIKLPDDCKPKDCCEGFRKLVKAGTSASANGNAALSGSIGAVGTGGSPIIRVEATLASVTINSAPVYGYFQNGSIANPFGTSPGVPPPYGHEVIWPTIPTGVSMGTMVPFTLNMKVPPIAGLNKRDTLRYCVRLRFTDKNCVTCDTLICYKVVRNKFIIHHGGGVLSRGMQLDGKGGDRNLQSAEETIISGSLTGTESGALDITFPAFPAELSGASYVGLTIETDDAELTDAIPQQSGYDFFTANSRAHGGFTANGGDHLTLDLKYNGLNNRNALSHRLTFHYVAGEDTLSEEITVVLRKDGLVGGDQLTPQQTALSNVRTYALHLNNANGSQESISRLLIGTQGGARILAVGPTSNDSIADLSFGSGNGIGENGDGSIALAPGSSYSPVYITVAGAEDNMVRVQFATMNAEGQTISTGEVVLASPLSSVKNAGDQGVTGGMLGRSFPNPVSGSATIEFAVATSDRVTLTLNDAAGREVARLVDNKVLGAGDHAAYVNAATLPSGTYYYTLRVGTTMETRSMQVIR